MNRQPQLSQEMATRIAYLVEGFLHETLSPEEHDELNRWVEQSDNHLMLFQQLTDEKELEEGISAIQGLDDNAVYSRLKKRIPFEKERKPIRLWPYAVAASLLLFIGGIYYFNTKTASTARPGVVAVQKGDLQPGGSKAVLTLSDGQTVILNAAVAKELASVTNGAVMGTDSGTIAYSPSGSSKAGYNTLSTPKGGQFAVTLSDGTKVWLNAASSLHYPVTFNTSERIVDLDGEAYFEVAHDVLHPFHVRSRGQDIKVLGTHFNVNAYKDEAVISTTLLQGSIRLSTSKGAVMVKPGEQYLADVSGALHKNSNADVEGATAWKEGIFHFRNATLEEILKQAGRWYDADIVYEQKVSDHFNADLSRNLPVSELLKILEKTGKVKFEIEERKLIVHP